jgi:hypothetical protein
MMQFQSQDDTGYLEIETGGSVFYRDREGDEQYLEWDHLPGEMQEFLSRFVDDAEAAFDEAIVTLQEAVAHEADDEDDGEGED